jgi:hypothetical protein
LKDFWLKEAESVLAAEEYLASGEVPDELLFEVAMQATGDEDKAQDFVERRMEMRAQQARERLAKSGLQE